MFILYIESQQVALYTHKETSQKPNPNPVWCTEWMTSPTATAHSCTISEVTNGEERGGMQLSGGSIMNLFPAGLFSTSQKEEDLFIQESFSLQFPTKLRKAVIKDSTRSRAHRNFSDQTSASHIDLQGHIFQIVQA